MTDTLDTILNALQDQEKALSAKVIELKMAESELARVRAAISALDVNSIGKEQSDTYDKKASWTEKIKFILRLKTRATVADMIEYIASQEPEIDTDGIKNTIMSTAWRLSDINEIKVKKVENNKNLYYI